MSTRSRSGITTLDCGCKCSDRAWTQECDQHKRVEGARHRRAQAEHRHETGRLSAADLETVRLETQAEEEAETTARAVAAQ